MKRAIRDLVLKSAVAFNEKVPYTPLAAKLGVFRAARTTRRYLASLCGQRFPADPGDLIRFPRPRCAKTPRKIWFLADLYWEPSELVPELQKISEVVTTDLKPGPGDAPVREKILQLVEKVHRQIEPDLILLYAREGLLSQGLFDLLKTKKVPIWGMNFDDKVEFFPDERNPYHGRDGYNRWASSFDLNLTCNRTLVSHYSAAGGNVAFFPEAYHPLPEFDQPRPAIVDSIGMVNSKREYRVKLIETLARYGLQVKTYGTGWDGSKMVTEPWRIYRTSQITLGEGLTPEAHTTNLKARDFQATGSNTCYLTTYDWELADQFEIGREILCYRDINELAEILYYYRERPEACAKIAQAGYERSKRDHTWEKRFRTLFERAY